MGVKDGVILLGLLAIKNLISKAPPEIMLGHALLRAISNTFSTSPSTTKQHQISCFIEPYLRNKGGLLRPIHVVFFFFDPTRNIIFWFRSLGYFGPTERLTQPILRVSNEIREKPSSQRSLACWFYFFVSPYELRDEQTPWFKRQILRKTTWKIRCGGLVDGWFQKT